MIWLWMRATLSWLMEHERDIIAANKAPPETEEIPVTGFIPETVDPPPEIIVFDALRDTPQEAPIIPPVFNDTDPDAVLSEKQRFIEQVFYRYGSVFYRIAERIVPDLADDIVQEALIAIFTHPPKEGEGSVKSYCMTIVTNKARDAWRRKHRHEQYVVFPEEDGDTDEDLLHNIIDERENTEAMIETQELQQTVHHHMRGLSPMYRQIVTLHSHGVSYKEIGAQLNIPENTAKTYFHRAKRLLREDLAGKDI